MLGYGWEQDSFGRTHLFRDGFITILLFVFLDVYLNRDGVIFSCFAGHFFQQLSRKLAGCWGSMQKLSWTKRKRWEIRTSHPMTPSAPPTMAFWQFPKHSKQGPGLGTCSFCLEQIPPGSDSPLYANDFSVRPCPRAFLKITFPNVPTLSFLYFYPHHL